MAVPTKRNVQIALGALLVIGVGGCAGDPLRTEVPGAKNTGTFPNLNLPTKSAAVPITADEKAAMFGRIGSAQNAQARAGANASATTNPLLLKTLGDKHGDETLKQIEGQ